jgi:hypothetical protein
MMIFKAIVLFLSLSALVLAGGEGIGGSGGGNGGVDKIKISKTDITDSSDEDTILDEAPEVAAATRQSIKEGAGSAQEVKEKPTLIETNYRIISSEKKQDK